jgi:tRNA (cmo5U34)-methyltransferase
MTHEHNDEHDWNNRDFALEWDQRSQVGSPLRREQLDILTALVQDICPPHTTILDLGIGSGLVEERLFAQRPDLKVVGVESSTAMIEIAQKRLAPYAQHCTYLQQDLSDTHALRTLLLEHPYQLALSVQVFHHIPRERQQALYQLIAALLPAGGILLNVERIAINLEPFAPLYHSLWNHLEKSNPVDGRQSEQGNYEYLHSLQHKGAHVATIEQHLAWLRQAGLEAVCLQLYLERAIFAGVKPG